MATFSKRWLLRRTAQPPNTEVEYYGKDYYTGWRADLGHAQLKTHTQSLKAAATTSAKRSAPGYWKYELVEAEVVLNESSARECGLIKPVRRGP